MNIKKLEIENIEEVVKVYDAARQIMRDRGNPHQWKDGYPTRADLEKDIENGILWGVFENGELCGSFAFLEGRDVAYDKIDGAWLNDNFYRAIHKVASSGKYKGVFGVICDFCKKAGVDLKIDTHEKNDVMKHLITKNGFEYCGIVEVLPNEPRLAYQYTFKE